jgi:TonB family protein
MFLPFDDDRPDIPRVRAALSRRTAIEVSLAAHALFLLFILFGLPHWTRSTVPVNRVAQDSQPIVFVEMAPLVDRSAPPKRSAEQSDQDRRSQTVEKAPNPENAMPFLRGNTPRKIQGQPEERLAGPKQPQAAPPTPATPPAASSPPLPPSQMASASAAPIPAPPAQPTPAVQRAAAGMLGQSLRNLQRYLQDQNFDNDRGGDTDHGADIQFDSMGVDFGPWLRRFKAQIYRNWVVPQAAELLKGHVVLQFVVLRDGTIMGLQVVEPSKIDAFTTAALTALKLSNPTAALPAEYPADRVRFTVTFHYNEPVQ